MNRTGQTIRLLFFGRPSLLTTTPPNDLARQASNTCPWCSPLRLHLSRPVGHPHSW